MIKCHLLPLYPTKVTFALSGLAVTVSEIDKIDKMSPFASASDKGDIFLTWTGAIDKQIDKMSPFASAFDKGDIFLTWTGAIDKLIDKMSHSVSLFECGVGLPGEDSTCIAMA